eukprot:6277432-Heterocapsa_arctica.AAC.1
MAINFLGQLDKKVEFGVPDINGHMHLIMDMDRDDMERFASVERSGDCAYGYVEPRQMWKLVHRLGH